MRVNFRLPVTWATDRWAALRTPTGASDAGGVAVHAVVVSEWIRTGGLSVWLRGRRVATARDKGCSAPIAGEHVIPTARSTADDACAGRTVLVHTQCTIRSTVCMLFRWGSLQPCACAVPPNGPMPPLPNRSTLPPDTVTSFSPLRRAGFSPL